MVESTRADYLALLAHARSPERAADLVLAHAAQTCAGLKAVYPDAERVAIIDTAAGRAHTLRQPWPTDEGAYPHPWRRWLQEWGYVPWPKAELRKRATRLPTDPPEAPPRQPRCGTCKRRRKIYREGKCRSCYTDLGAAGSGYDDNA